MNERGDAELVREALGGRQEAFGRLVERYKDAVFGAAFHRLGDFEEARDAAQETFVKAFRNLAKLKRPEAFANWLYRIAAGTALDAARRRRGELSLDDIGEVAEVTESSEDVRAGKAWAALETLPEATRLAVILHYVDGYSHAQVAQFLGTTEGAVKTRVSRGRAKLREEMATMVRRRLKDESPVFVYEATDASGRVTTGRSSADSAARVRRRLTEKGYRLVRFEPESLSSDERIQRGNRVAASRVADTILAEALKHSASRIRIALPMAKAERQLTVSYLIGEAWHEVMAMPTYVWEPLRMRLAEMAGVDLREEAARQRGRIRFVFEGREGELRATFGRRVMRLEVRD